MPLPPTPLCAPSHSLLGEEVAANPFLRPDAPAIRASLGVALDASDDAAFAAIRAAKDSFR